ncbi:MAG: 3-isopropylmalate dehydrogenase [Lentisphaerae bacterium]|nr:3-isopropylmalate dehydrogenase [Lentisphaerota bacterium]
MNFNIAVLPGDGIGPEISRQGVAVMKAVCQVFGHSVKFTDAPVGAAAIDALGDPFPPETEKLCLASDAILFSAVGDPKYDLDPNAMIRPEQGLLAMRKKLGLFANIRPVQTFAPLLHQSPLRPELVADADFICIRELTGGMYFGDKVETDEFASDVNAYSKGEVVRILRTAFEYARKRRKFLTVVDKANVLATGRLWRKTAQEMSADYPDVTVEYMYVDNAAMRMIREPAHFDVMVTENTFGDILTDEGSVISGSLGLLPSASLGEKTPLFEPIHGSFPQAKGKNIANPLAQILSVAMLFEHFDCPDEGNLIRQAVNASLQADIRTADIQTPGITPCSTTQVGEWIVNYIQKYGSAF